MLIPDNPIDRMLELHAALEARRSWTQSPVAIRFAAITMLLAKGEPADIADRLYSEADAIKKSAGWFGQLNSPGRFLIAAMLVREGLRAQTFLEELHTAQEWMKTYKVRGMQVAEAMAVLLIHTQTGRAVAEPDIARMATMYHLLDETHPWLTGSDDLAASALLAGSEGDLKEVRDRVDHLYDELHELGYRRGNRLQLCSHILGFHPLSDESALSRFHSIYEACKSDGFFMHSGDYADVALLTFVGKTPEDVVTLVRSHRDRLHDEMRPKVNAELAFDLACATAVIELAGRHGLVGGIHDVHSMATVQAILAAQQAAATSAIVVAASS